MNTHLKTKSVEKALSLGCGGGNLERALIKLEAAKQIDAYDVSTESIRLAKELADREGMGDRIYYEQRDINTLLLPPNTYDFVIIKMALHHFEQLEHLYAQIATTLKAGGVLVFNEFIGPSRFQWTELQLQLMNRLLAALPEKNTWSGWTQGYLKEIARPAVADMIAMDPSESVRSDEIMPKLKDYFEVVEYKPYGGTLLHILLTHVMPTFDLEDPDQKALLRMLFVFEKTLLEHGVIESDFAYVVARPLASRPARAASYKAPLLQTAQQWSKRAMRAAKSRLRRLL
jgi:SAM-dependent methyltransferase